MDPFLAEIRIFPFYFAPKGWAHCEGQVMPLSQNTALFALLGTMYGGDGKSTFALPDLQGRAAMHRADEWQGTEGGSATVTLLTSEIPAHTHTLTASTEPAGLKSPSGQMLARGQGVGMYSPPDSTTTTMAHETLAPSGGSQPHNNMQPFLALKFNIAMQGVFPQRP